MKLINHKSFALSAGLLALGSALSVAQPSQAAPPRNNDVRQERQDVQRARREVQRQRQDVRQAQTPVQRRQEQRDVQQARQDLLRQRQDVRRERQQAQSSYTGQVLRVRSANSFDVSIAGNSFNVYTLSGLPRGLSVGDRVQINGVQQNKNDIRQASVSILRNR